MTVRTCGTYHGSKNNYYVPKKCREIIAAHISKIGDTIGNKIMCAADFAL